MTAPLTAADRADFRAWAEHTPGSWRVLRLLDALDAAEAKARQVEDCGQDGVCAIAPGCCRHWAERSRELAAEREALEAFRAQTIRALVKLDYPGVPDGAMALEATVDQWMHEHAIGACEVSVSKALESLTAERDAALQAVADVHDVLDTAHVPSPEDVSLAERIGILVSERDSNMNGWGADCQHLRDRVAFWKGHAHRFWRRLREAESALSFALSTGAAECARLRAIITDIHDETGCVQPHLSTPEIDSVCAKERHSGAVEEWNESARDLREAKRQLVDITDKYNLACFNAERAESRAEWYRLAFERVWKLWSESEATGEMLCTIGRAAVVEAEERITRWRDWHDTVFADFQKACTERDELREALRKTAERCRHSDWCCSSRANDGVEHSPDCALVEADALLAKQGAR